jgi:hypothetical protein
VAAVAGLAAILGTHAVLPPLGRWQDDRYLEAALAVEIRLPRVKNPVAT